MSKSADVPVGSSVAAPQFNSVLSQSLALKLDRKNYTLWKAMVSTIVRGHQLDGFLLGTDVCPPEMIDVVVSEADEKTGKAEVTATVFNPKFGQWIVTDSLLKGWLYGSMTESVAMEVVECATSADLWRGLAVLYGAHNKAKVDETRTLIQTTRKGELSMEEYLRKMKGWADVLAIAGNPYSNESLVANILSGLDTEYMPIIVSIEQQPSTTWQELQDKLLSYDSKLERINTINGVAKTVNMAVAQPAANFVARSDSQYSRDGSRGGRFQGGSRGNYRSGSRGSFRGSSNRITCQICGRFNHTAKNCYDRYEENMSSAPSNHSTGYSKGNSSSAYVVGPEVADYDAWYVDSGASNHVTGNVNNLGQKVTYDGKEKLTVGNGNSLLIQHVGNSKMISHYKDPILLKNILHVPDITKNLVSVSKLTKDNDVFVEFFRDFCFVKDKQTGKVIIRGKLRDGLYQLQPKSFVSSSKVKSINQLKSSPFSGLATVDRCLGNSDVLSSRIGKKDLWHRRLGHPSEKVVSQVLSLINEKNFVSEKQRFCDACQMGKSHALPFKNSLSRAKKVLDLIHTDVWGPAPVHSTNNYKFYIHFVDDHSRFTWIYPLKAKSEAFAAFKDFKTLVENKFDRKIKCIQSDFGGEFVAFKAFLQVHGIESRHSCPHTSAQNGRAERKHRHIAETGLTLLSQASMPRKYWVEAFSTAVYLINRLPTAVLGNKSPYEVLFDVIPDYRFLKTFGAACYPCLRPYQQNKFQFHTSRCVNLGYSESAKGFRCLSSTGRVYLSRDVVFNEEDFPFATGFLNTRQDEQRLNVDSTTWFTLPTSSLTNTETNTSARNSENERSYENERDTATNTETFTSARTSTSERSYENDATNTETFTSARTADTERSSEDTPQQVTYSARSHASHNKSPSPGSLASSSPCLHPPQSGIGSDSINSNLSGQLDSTNTMQQTEMESCPLQPSHRMVTRAKAGIFKPKLYLLDSVITEPSSVQEALLSEGWKAAMKEEFLALSRNNTWSLVPFSSRYNIVGNKWVFKTKLNADGSFQRYKARLVAKGFHQRPGIDFSETFSPVVKPSTVRVILSIAVSKGWSINQLDINNAFLNGKLVEDVYMVQPEGFVDQQKPHYVCKLSKALYGLRQAPRAWFDRLRSTLLSWKFKNSKADSSLFIYKTNTSIMLVLVYVDDIIVTGNNESELKCFTERLNRMFALKDLGKLHYFLGIEVTRDNTGMYLSQRKYVEELLDKHGMSQCKPCPTPMTVGKSLSAHDGEPLEHPTMYRSIIGALQYLTHTRPDISFAVNNLSQFLQSPTTTHWNSVKRILRYLRGTTNLSLHIRFSERLCLQGYSDADWASSPDDRRSVGGYCVYLGDTLVAWSSKKQGQVARSSTESEYRALAQVAAEISWIQALLGELEFPLPCMPVTWCDNMSANALASNPVYHARTKHIELDVHYVRDKVLQNELKVLYIPTSDQVADCLTKPLTHTRFQMFRSKLGVTEVPSRLRGGVRIQELPP